MQLCGMRDRLAFHHLLEQVNAAARTIKFVAKKLIGWARCVAETAMDATAQNGVGFLAFRGGFKGGGEICLHGRATFGRSRVDQGLTTETIRKLVDGVKQGAKVL